MGPRALEGAERYFQGGGPFVCTVGSMTGVCRRCQQFAACFSTGLPFPPGIIRVFGQIVQESEERV